LLKTGAPSLRNQAGSWSKPVAVGRSVSRIHCVQIPWRRLFLAALWAKPGGCCCLRDSLCRVIAALHGRLLYVV